MKLITEEILKHFKWFKQGFTPTKNRTGFETIL